MTHYEILGVSEDADLPAVKKAYRKLATEWHPDKHQNKETYKEAEDKFKKISEAYSILGDENKRKEYDAQRKGGGIPLGFHTTGDPFEFFFSQSGPFSFARSQQRQNQERPLRGQSIEIEQSIPLIDALFGTEVPLEFSTKSGCEECKMLGATEFDTCSTCHGAGFSIQKQGSMIIQTTCPACRGNAQSPKNTCPKCHGAKFLQEMKRFTVRIPQGIKHKTILRLAGMGGKGFLGGLDGDVLIQILVEYPNLNILKEEEKVSLRELLVRG